MATIAPVLTIAKNNIPKGMAPMESLLNDLMEKEFITKDIYDRIKADEDIAHYFAPPKTKAKAKAKAKTSTRKSTPKKNLEERDAEAFDGCRCSARMWEAEKGLGYHNIQCSKATKISKEDAEDILNEFKDKMNDAQVEGLQNYVEKYDGCFCKNHLKQDFFMPNGWWLGKVNEDRPEKPMLPKGSFKDGYQDDYKEHQWMYDADGNKVEKKSGRRGSGKKKKEEPKAEEPKAEEPKAEEPKAEEPVELENVEVEVADPVPEDDGAGTGLKPKEEEEEKEEDEEKEDQPYIIDGVEYTNVWDEEDGEWLVTYDGEHVGWPITDGDSEQINFADPDEEDKHAKRVEEL